MKWRERVWRLGGRLITRSRSLRRAGTICAGSLLEASHEVPRLIVALMAEASADLDQRLGVVIEKRR